jgi:hypothetical protein
MLNGGEAVIRLIRNELVDDELGSIYEYGLLRAQLI